MVRAFAERGADVIIASRKLDNCETVADEVRALGRRALAVQVHAAKWDVDRPPDRDRLRRVRPDRHPRQQRRHEPADAEPRGHRGAVRQRRRPQLQGAVPAGLQVAKRMHDGDGGVIINVTSSGSLMPLPGVVPYGSAKAALNAMTRSLAAEYGPKVRVNTLSPGPFLTDISKAWPDEARETRRQRPRPARATRRRSSPPRCSSPARRRASRPAPSSASTAACRSASERPDRARVSTPQSSRQARQRMCAARRPDDDRQVLDQSMPAVE